MESPSVLILGGRFDITCDYVVSQLRRRGCLYLRLNSDDLPQLHVSLDPVGGTLVVRFPEEQVTVDAEDLRAVYFRRPVFLRAYGGAEREPYDTFQRQQWAVFTRNLMVFDRCLWMNHPQAIYLAEHKGVQLRTAAKVGFSIPETRVSNHERFVPRKMSRDGKVIVKGLDTVLLRNGIYETFGFTNTVRRESLSTESLQAIPTVFQEPITSKLDIRVTVVGNKVFSASIRLKGNPIEGDWRQQKPSVGFQPYELPRRINDKCIELIQELGLSYGAIDLAVKDGRHYFLEVNPTGEWAWLVDSAGLPIDEAIALALTESI